MAPNTFFFRREGLESGAHLEQAEDPLSALRKDTPHVYRFASIRNELDAEDRARRGHPLPDHLHFGRDLTLYSPVLKDPAYILSSGSDAGLRWGALIDVIVALAGIGTAITLYPVVRRQNEAVALGFVTSRVIEGAMLLTGVVSLLSLASLHQAGRRGRRRLDRASHQVAPRSSGRTTRRS